MSDASSWVDKQRVQGVSESRIQELLAQQGHPPQQITSLMTLSEDKELALATKRFSRLWIRSLLVLVVLCALGGVYVFFFTSQRLAPINYSLLLAPIILQLFVFAIGTTMFQLVPSLSKVHPRFVKNVLGGYIQSFLGLSNLSFNTLMRLYVLTLSSVIAILMALVFLVLTTQFLL